jgi:tetratricopeptide (TPR) repeat protein
MPETTRAHALERLEASGEGAATRRRHAEHCVDRMKRASDDWLRLPDSRWHQAHAAELDNVRAALDWAQGEEGDRALAMALAGASGPLWFRLSLMAEGIEHLRAALACEASGDSLAARARLWFWFGVLTEGETVESLAAYDRAVAIYRELGDPDGLGLALVLQGRVLTLMGRLEAAEAALSEAQGPLQDSSAPKTMGLYWANLGHLRKCQGDTAGARASFATALEIQHAAGAEFGAMVTLGALADLSWLQGDLEAAADAFRQNIELLRRSPNSRRSALGLAFCNLAGVLIEMGELDEALEVTREGLPALRDSGFAWLCMDHFALRIALAGNYANAARLSGYSDAAYRKRHAPREANEARALERLRTLLAKNLAEGVLQDLRGQGAELDEEAACRIATEGS